MQWTKYMTAWELAKQVGAMPRNVDIKEFYRRITAMMLMTKHGIEGISTARDGTNQIRLHDPSVMIEPRWMQIKRPFFNVYPSIIDGLLKTSLTLPSMAIDGVLDKMPIAMLFRFQHPLQSGLVSFLAAYLKAENDDTKICLLVDSGRMTPEKILDFTVPTSDAAHSRLVMSLLPDQTLEDAVKLAQARIPEHYDKLTPQEEQACEDALRIFCGVALLCDDPRIVERVVLQRDAKKFALTGEKHLIERAERNGVVGWSVGAHVEVAPHYRRAHFGIRWTGEGRKIPKLVPIKGCIVHRELIGEVPTGYLGEYHDE